MAQSQSPPVPSALDTLMQDMLMKRRLIIDGDGMGDERKIVNLMRMFLSLCSETDPVEQASLEKKCLNLISQVEHMLKKTLSLTKVHEEGTKSYEFLGEKVKSEITKTKEDISDSKALLEEARLHRKRMTEYSALAQVISNQADRKETEKKKAALDGTLGKLKSRYDELGSRINERKAVMAGLADTIKTIDELVYGEERKVKEREEAKAKAAAVAAAAAASAKKAEAKSQTPMDVDEPQPTSSNALKAPKRISEGPAPAKQQLPTVEPSVSNMRSVKGTKPLRTPEKMDVDKSEKYDDLSD